MNKLILLTAVLATVAQAFPSDDVLTQLLRRGTGTGTGTGTKRDVECSRHVSNDMRTCVAPVESIIHPSSGIVIDQVETAEDLDDLCSSMHTAKDCVTEVHAQCGQGDMVSEMLTDTIVRVVTYICSAENRDVILNNNACWKDKELNTAINNCRKGIRPRPNESRCGVFDQIRSCVKREVRSHCNSNDAADFMDGLLYHNYDNMAHRMHNCHLSQRVERSLWDMLPYSRK